MPFANPEDKKRWNLHWKKQGKEIGYNKWLYDRRKARFDDAQEFREVLERIAGGEYHAQNLAKAALKSSKRRHAKVGPSPRANGVATTIPDQEASGDSLAEALAKLGLPV